MGALVLGIVLIIGYHYQSYHPIRRLELKRQNGYHIYFKAGFSGFILLSCSIFTWILIDFYDFPSKFIENNGLDKSTYLLGAPERWNEAKAAAIFILMFALSNLYVISAKAYYKIKKEKFFKKIIKVANDLEELVIIATYNAESIRIELDCGKVYVGIPESPDLKGGEVKYVTILPLLSGYRDENKNIVFTNNYADHYEDSFPIDESREVNGHRDIMDFYIVIPVSDIVIASNFNLDAFVKIQESDPKLLPSKGYIPKDWLYTGTSNFKMK